MEIKVNRFLFGDEPFSKVPSTTTSRKSSFGLNKLNLTKAKLLYDNFSPLQSPPRTRKTSKGAREPPSEPEVDPEEEHPPTLQLLVRENSRPRQINPRRRRREKTSVPKSRNEQKNRRKCGSVLDDKDPKEQNDLVTHGELASTYEKDEKEAAQPQSA